MSQKKCPKCGELNPPEAVMCWACYTPLTGGAPGSAPMAPSGPLVSEGVAKASIPPWQLGLVGVGLLLALGFGAKTVFGGSGGGDEGMPIVTAPSDSGNTQPEMPAASPAAVPPAPAPVANPPADAAVPAPQRTIYDIVSIPNANYNWGTMAIVLTDPSTSPRKAAAVAAFVRQKMMQNKKWQILHIYVFTDRQAAVQFKIYQDNRKGAPLGLGDMRNLGAAWARVPVRYEYNRGSEGILYPSRNPSNWWTGKTIYVKVKQ